MTERDIARVEKTLGVTLPAHYRRFLRDDAAALARARRAGAFVPFFTKAGEIIDANKDLRADPSLRDTNHDTEPWPLKYLIVGSDGGGDDWCVDMTDEREVIWLFDSEAHGTFRHASPATWTEYLAEARSPKTAEPLPVRDFLCKRGSLAPEAAGDGSFALTDTKGRDWVCFETKEPTPEEILARIRGEVRTPTWLGEKGLKSLTCASVEELRTYLSGVADHGAKSTGKTARPSKRGTRS